MGPATKRRKLKHEEEQGSDSDGSFGEDNVNSAISNGDGDDDDDDISMDELENMDADGASSEEDSEDEDEETRAPAAKQPKSTAKPADAEKSKQRRKSDAQPQGGAYTAETFKSNVFKLQVDELLDQVKLRYGKKEAPVENAMRALKTLIEQIPSREPLPVRIDTFSMRKTNYDIARRSAKSTEACRCDDTIPQSPTADRREIQIPI